MFFCLNRVGAILTSAILQMDPRTFKTNLESTLEKKTFLKIGLLHASRYNSAQIPQLEFFVKKLSSSGLTPLISSALVKNDSDFDITEHRWGLTIRQSCDSVRINEGTMAPCAQTTCCENTKVSACGFIIALHSPHRENQKRSTERVEKTNSIFHMRRSPCKCF